MPTALRPPGAALAAGVLVALALPPLGWWPLAPVGVAVLDAATAGRRGRARAGLGWVAGVGLLAPGWWWMAEFHAAGYVLAVALVAGLFAAGLAAAPPGRGRWVGLPAALVLVEGARGMWPFGGVPVATVAATQVDGPLAPVARLGGPLLLTAAVAGAGVALAAAARRTWPAAGAAAGAVVAVAVAGAVAPLPHPTGDLRAALVQGGGERGSRALFTDEAQVFARHLQASGAVPRPVDLVLWPEDVVDVAGPVTATPEGDALAALARQLGATVVAGVVESGDDRFFNAAVAWGPDGRPVARYDKVQRVPFGEYIPARGLVEAVADTSFVPRDAVAGAGPGLLGTPAGDLGVIVSYEVFFPRRAAAAVGAGGEVLLLPTNASSYSTGQMPALVLAATRLRALETGRTVLQAAPTGFTAVVGPEGQVRQRSRLGEQGVLTATVTTRQGSTPYGVVGDGPTGAAAAAALVAAWARARRPRPALTPRAAG